MAVPKVKRDDVVYVCVHMGLDGGKGENGYHVTKGLVELIVSSFAPYV